MVGNDGDPGSTPGGGAPPGVQAVQRLLTGALIAVMTVVAVALTLAVRGITGMEPDFVLRVLAGATVIGAAAGGWIGRHRSWLAGGLSGAAGTAGFVVMTLRTAGACERLDLAAQAAALRDPLVWLAPAVLAVSVLAGWGAARLRRALS